MRKEYLLDTLGESDNRHAFLDAQLAKHGVGTRELTFTSIDNNQIGEFCSLVEQSAVSASDNFAHCGEVVCTDDGFDVKVAILFA